MKKIVIAFLSISCGLSAHAQIYYSANTIGTNNSALGVNNNVIGDWSFASGTFNFIEDEASVSFASGKTNTLKKSATFAFGLANVVNAPNSGAFGQANNVLGGSTSFAFGSQNRVTGSFSFAMGLNTTAQGDNTFVIGRDITNTTSNSFLVGYGVNEPALMVSGGTGSSGPLVGIGTDNPQSRLDIRLGDEQDILIQSQVPNTYGGIAFKHSDGTDNWRITAYSNFPGGYGNVLGIVSQGSSQDDLWIAARRTLIGDYFDFSGCTDCNDYLLFVKRGIRTEKVKIDVAAGTWADYVFSPDYQLPSLPEVEQFIKENNHLPDVPCASDMESNGLDVAKTDALLLQKIEELTLYLIEMKNDNEQLEKAIGNLENNIK